VNEKSPQNPTPLEALPIRAKWLEPSALVVILVLAVALRFWGIKFGFPEHVRPDEQYFVNATQRFDRLNTLDPDFFLYPAFYMYVNLAVWRGYTLYQFFRGNYQVSNVTPRQPPGYGLELIRARLPDMEFLLGRCATALFGVATVLIVYAMTRRFYGRKAAVAAAFLLAINGLHTLNSHFYKSDVATTFFTMAALGCMACFVQCRGTRWNVGAAVCSGLAASTNYYGGFLLAPLLASQFMARYENRTTEARKENSGETHGSWPARLCVAAWVTARAVLKGLASWETYAMPAIALAVFAGTSPYCFIRWTAFLDAFHRMLFSDRQSLYDTLVRIINFDDFGFRKSPLQYSLLFCFRYSMGLVLFVVSAGGLIFLASRRQAVGWLLLLFFMVHFVMTASGKAVFMRYYLSLVPVPTIAVGVLLSWRIQKQWPDRAGKQNVWLAVVLVLCGAGSFLTSVQQDRLLARKDTRVEAREWLARNLPPNATVGTPVDWWGNYYPYGKPTLPGGRGYIPVAPDRVRAGGIRYLVVDDSLLRLYSPMERSGWSSWLAANTNLLKEISPYDRPDSESRARYDQLDAFYVPVAGFKGIARPGPRIRIYEVRSTP